MADYHLCTGWARILGEAATHNAPTIGMVTLLFEAVSLSGDGPPAAAPHAVAARIAR
jgi:hypothetical protein